PLPELAARILALAHEPLRVFEKLAILPERARRGIGQRAGQLRRGTGLHVHAWIRAGEGKEEAAYVVGKTVGQVVAVAGRHGTDDALEPLEFTRGSVIVGAPDAAGSASVRVG